MGSQSLLQRQFGLCSEAIPRLSVFASNGRLICAKVHLHNTTMGTSNSGINQDIYPDCTLWWILIIAVISWEVFTADNPTLNCGVEVWVSFRISDYVMFLLCHYDSVWHNVSYTCTMHIVCVLSIYVVGRNVFQTLESTAMPTNLTWPKLMKLDMEQQHMLSVLHNNQYDACWCSDNFKSQCISRYGIDPLKLEYSVSSIRRV